MRAILVALGCGLALAGRLAAGPPPIRIVTLNVLHGGDLAGWWGDAHALEERLAITIEELRRLDPDVVGLQEASVGRRRGDVAARIAEALGLEHVFAPVRPFGSRVLGVLGSAARGFEEGPALLSRFPIRAAEPREVRGCGAYRRILLCAELGTPAGPLDACSTHVDGGACQADALRALVEARRRPAVPFILTGDLNATDDAPGIRRLIDEVGLVDVFRRANPGVPGPTVWQAVETEPRMARRRVDYVLFAPAGDRPARVVSSRIVLDAPRRRADGSALWPSDHYGVLAEIDVFAPR